MSTIEVDRVTTVQPKSKNYDINGNFTGHERHFLCELEIRVANDIGREEGGRDLPAQDRYIECWVWIQPQQQASPKSQRAARKEIRGEP